MHATLLSFSLLAAGALSLVADDDATPADGTVSAPVPLTNVVALGASVSAGYGNAAELETADDTPLSVFLHSMLREDEAKRVEISGEGDRWFFADPRKSGTKQVDAALAAGPSLVVAVDFLFWYAYGRSTKRDPRRAVGLEEGLRQLDRIGCPIVVGDLPDISYALDGKGPFGAPVVHRGLFPTDEQRVAMNETIRAWAERRGDVAIVSLQEMTSNTVQGRPVVVRDQVWTVTDLSDALQDDLLHPKVRGSIWIALMVADAATRLDGVEPDAFVWDERKVRERVWASTEESRRARAKKERERRERREKRDRAREKRDRALVPH